MDSDQDSDQVSEDDGWAFAIVKTIVNFKEKYDCIPTSWIVKVEECVRGYHSNVTYLFPSYEKLGTGMKFYKTLPPNKNWPNYLGKILLHTDCHAEAFRFINKEKKRIRSLQIEMGQMCDTTSESDSEEDLESRRKRSRTKRKQSEQENKNQNIQAKAKKLTDDLDKKIDADIVDARTQLYSHCYKFYDEFNASYQKSMSILDNTADFLQKMISAHKDNTAANTKLPSSLPTNQRHYDETPNDGKWTLRYTEPGPGIIELMPNTGVYVSEQGLSECQFKYITITGFTRGVLELVFTEEAIRKCSFTGQPQKGKEKTDLQVRPGLDLGARKTLVSYIEQYGIEKGWLDVRNPTKTIIGWIKNKLSEAYQKSKKP